MPFKIQEKASQEAVYGLVYIIIKKSRIKDVSQEQYDDARISIYLRSDIKLMRTRFPWTHVYNRRV